MRPRHDDPSPTQFGQRPLFSEPGENQPQPTRGALGTEARLDDVVPVDRSSGSKATTNLEQVGLDVGVILPYSIDNVSNPPTEAQLDAAFGTNPAGWFSAVVDSGGAGQVWLVMRSVSNADGFRWWYEALTRAT